MEVNAVVCNCILQKPVETLAILDKSFVLAQFHVRDTSDVRDQKHMSVKTNAHVRCIRLPQIRNLQFQRIPRSGHVGKLINFVGTVIRVPEWLKWSKVESSLNVPRVAADFTFRSSANLDISECKRLGSNLSECRDYQEIKVQEQVTKLELGTIPRSIIVLLEDDLADSCKPGDDVSIVYGFFSAAMPITVLCSFNPNIVGMSLVKLAVMLVLCGGVSKLDKSGLKMRGDSHILLVGDPGTGKSQFLRYAARISPRAVLTTGIGSTNAGLTVTAVKDSGEWQLEAGALVLADRGLCCIDEFGSIKEQDKTAIHEAMEQQTISVAKAGLVCKLNTRCSILAATNPKGKYDPTQSMEVNVALGSPLLSRFDLILTLLDTQNDEWDKKVSSFILNLEDSSKNADQHQTFAGRRFWNADTLQAYLMYIKSHFQPFLTEPANEILKRYYQIQRGSDLRNAARTTIRLLESLIRLAQSHARLMFREHVTVQDAVTAIVLVEASMNSTSLDGIQSPLHSAFPSDGFSGTQEYRKKEISILQRLGLASLSSTEIGSPKEISEEREVDEEGDLFDDDGTVYSWEATQRE
ncbi:DNA helicase mcm9 [Entophlyctis sp. JEL0112]|nr:DNA helicase mcm9 [Entophlyctis sp. JEL0112]